MDTVTMQSTGPRSPGELAEILALLLARQVPLIHGTRLLCDVTGIDFKQVADAAGIGRGHLYKMLRGIRPVSVSARQAFMDCLGIDPWMTSFRWERGAVPGCPVGLDLPDLAPGCAAVGMVPADSKGRL